MNLRNIKTKSTGLKLRSGRQLHIVTVRRRVKLEKKFEIVEQEERISETPYQKMKRMWHEAFSPSNEQVLSQSEQDYIDNYF